MSESIKPLAYGELMPMQMGSWEFLLLLGRAERSEVLCKKALDIAERNCGPNSPEAGLCLMEIADILEREGRVEEAEDFTTRYRAILCRFAIKFGIT